jgi:ribosomal protein S26
MKLKKYTEGRKNYFKGRKKYVRHFECRRFTVNKQAKVIHKLDTWNEVNKIREAEGNIVNRGAPLSVVKIYEWL